MNIKRPMIFFAPEAAGGATMEAPADVQDVSTYVPPSIESIDADLERGGDFPSEPEPAPRAEPKQEVQKTEPAFPPVPKEGEQQKPETKPAPKGKQPATPAKKEPSPVDHLRSAYEESKTKLAEYEQELSTLRTNHPEVAQLRKDIEAERARVADYEKRQEDYEKRLAAHDPAATRRRAEMDRKFNEDYAPQVQEIPKLAGEYNKLVAEFIQLPRGTPEFDEAVDAFEQSIEDRYGARRAERVLSLVRAGYQHRLNIANMENELREQGGKFLFNERLKEYGTAAEEFAKDSESFLDVDPTIVSADPYHPVLFLQHCAKEDSEKFNDLKGKAIEVAKRAFIGPKPRTKEDFPGLDDKQIAEAMDRDAREAAQARKVAQRLAVQGSLAMAYMRPFFARYKAMEAKLAEQGSDLPPDETTTQTTQQHGSGAYVDPTTYEAPPVPNESEFA